MLISHVVTKIPFRTRQTTATANVTRYFDLRGRIIAASLDPVITLTFLPKYFLVTVEVFGRELTGLSFTLIWLFSLNILVRVDHF